MTKQELINELKAIGTEYMYQDIGYGGFYGTDNTFKCNGIIYKPTKAELKEMLDQAYYDLIGDEQDIKELCDLLVANKKARN